MEFDWSLAAQNLLHSSPMLAIIGFASWKFIRGHMHSMKEISENISKIQISLAEANLPEIKEDLRRLQVQMREHEKEDMQNHMKFLEILGKLNAL